jgi:signal transduction histidine kinase
VVVIALLTLAEYVAGGNLGIDELLADDRLQKVGAAPPGRMGANTAACFLLLSAATFALDLRRGRLAPIVLAAAAAAIAYAATLGYLFEVPRLETGFVTRNVTPMALHSALAILVVAGTLIWRAGLGSIALGDTAGAVMARRLLPAAVVLPPALAFVRLKGQHAGYYGTEEGLALFATSVTVVFVSLIALTARSLHLADLERRRVEERMAQARRLESIGQLTAGIAHDFNNIVTVVGGYAQLLEGRSQEPSAEVREIRTAAARAKALTSQLLAFGRRQVLVPAPVDLNEVARNVGPMLERLIGEDVALRLELAPDTPTVLADPGQLEQVLVNLVVNARDAMPDGGTVTIETADAEPDDGGVDGRHAVLLVSDTGVGMDEETAARIFEPFFTTKPVGSGTGLGLSTVHGIVEQSGGEISISSEPGSGTTFRVRLPATDEPPQQRAARAESPADAWPRGTETVLVVEDDDGLRKLAELVLGHCGYDVLSAGHPGQALEVIDAHGGAIHLLLTDLVMPGGGGPELAHQVSSAHPEIRVIFMSGYSERAVAAQGVIAPGSVFLEKPFFAEQLSQTVRDSLDAPR